MNKDLHNEFDRLNKEWCKAIVANNPQWIERFMADEWVIIDKCGITQKEHFLALVASGDLTHEAMEGNVKRVRVYGDTAVVTARGTNNGHYKGQPFSADEWITDVFVKRDGHIALPGNNPCL